MNLYMVNQELIDYIKQEVAKGDSRETIINNLVQSGWEKEDILEGMNQLGSMSQQNNNSQNPNAQKSHIAFLNNITIKFRFFFFNFFTRNGKLKIALAVIVLLVLFLGALIPAVTVYANVKIPLMSDKFRRGIVVFTYHIPFLPKTSEQIILAAVENNTELRAYTPDFSLSASLSSADITGMSLDLKASGPVVISDDENISFDLSFSGDANLLIANVSASGKLRKVGDNAYAKIDKFPEMLLGFAGFSGESSNSSEIKQNLDELFKNWIAISSENDFQSEAKENLQKSQETMIAQVQEGVQDFLLKSDVLSETKKMPDEEVDGEPTYHLKLVPSKTLVRALIKEYTSRNKDEVNGISLLELENNFTNSIKAFEVDVWFGKKDTILRKTSLVAKFDMSKFGGYMNNDASITSTSSLIPGLTSLADTTLSISTVLKISDINKASSISKPSQTMTSQQFSSAFQKALKTKAQKNASAREELFNSYFSSINNSLTNYYLKNRTYPTSLSELTGEYLSPTDKAVQNLSSITFQFNQSRSEFIAYTTMFDGKESYLYGITSSSSYPHKLVKYDIDLIIRPTSSSQ